MKKLPANLGRLLLQLSDVLWDREREFHPWHSLPSSSPGLLGGSLNLLGRIHAAKSITEAFTPEIESQAAFVWLRQDKNFRKAEQAFDHTAAAKDGDAPERALAKVRFVASVASHIGLGLMMPDSWEPPAVYEEDRQRARSTVTALMDLIDKGIQLPNPLDNWRLRALLETLSKELDTPPEKRAYADSAARQRWLLTRLARSLLAARVERAAVVTIVESLAPIMGLSPDHRTVQRYVHAAAGKA